MDEPPLDPEAPPLPDPEPVGVGLGETLTPEHPTPSSAVQTAMSETKVAEIDFIRLPSAR